MKCRSFRQHCVELLDTGDSTPRHAELMAHLRSCSGCGRLYGEMTRTMSALRLPHRVAASPRFKEQVMDRAAAMVETVRHQTGNPRSRQSGLRRPALVAATVVLVVAAQAAVNWLGSRSAPVPMSALGVLAEAAEAVSRLRSFHFSARIRTTTHDHLDLIDPSRDFVPLAMWKQFGDPPKWRLEKPRLVVAMDGEACTSLMKSPGALYAAEGRPDAGFVTWLRPLLHPDQVFESERRLAGEEGAEVTLREEGASGDVSKLVLTVEAKARGNFENDWMKGRTIETSDHRRVYRFDAQSNLLEGLQVFVKAGDREILVFETVEIEYNLDLDPALFELDIPKAAIWYRPPEERPDDDKYQGMSPEETARAFLRACGEEDWAEALKLWPWSSIEQHIKDRVGGLEIIRIGRAFKSGPYPVWFVPYEVRLKSGRILKQKLALRNDNPAGRWMMNGGI